MLFKIKNYDWWLYHFLLLSNLCYCEIDAEDIPEDSIHVIYSGIYTPNTDDVALKLCKNVYQRNDFKLFNRKNRYYTLSSFKEYIKRVYFIGSTNVSNTIINNNNFNNSNNNINY